MFSDSLSVELLSVEMSKPIETSLLLHTASVLRRYCTKGEITADAAFAVCVQLIVITCPMVAEAAELEAFVIVRSGRLLEVVVIEMVSAEVLFVSFDSVTVD